MTDGAYVYVASSWRNHYQVAMCAAIKAAGRQQGGFDCYDFKHDGGGPDKDGFRWSDVDPTYRDHLGDFDHYRKMLDSPIALKGFATDFEALKRATHCVLVLPAGRSANLEAGYAIGKGIPTCVWMPEYDEPDLMYLMADLITDSLTDVLGWLGVKD